MCLHSTEKIVSEDYFHNGGRNFSNKVSGSQQIFVLKCFWMAYMRSAPRLHTGPPIPESLFPDLFSNH
jgi:hypothetical protein